MGPSVRFEVAGVVDEGFVLDAVGGQKVENSSNDLADIKGELKNVETKLIKLKNLINEHTTEDYYINDVNAEFEDLKTLINEFKNEDSIENVETKLNNLKTLIADQLYKVIDIAKRITEITEEREQISLNEFGELEYNISYLNQSAMTLFCGKTI